jgi:Protein of unknown function (DUF2950)
VVAIPAEHRVTGVNTSMVSYDGVAYQKGLGSATPERRQNMDRYNPDKMWRNTNNDWALGLPNGQKVERHLSTHMASNSSNCKHFFS